MSAKTKLKCPNCAKSLLAPSRIENSTFKCPACAKSFKVPMVLPVRKAAMPPPLEYRASPEDDATVPVGVTLPCGVGEVKAQVTKKTADSIILTTVGGFLVAVGMVLMAILTGGKNRPKS
jgi:hypothetical protein